MLPDLILPLFESEGGLLAINSQKKLAILENLCKRQLKILFLDRIEIINTASYIYADLRSKGTPIQFPDILIAATAIYHNLVLVSNDSDMLRIEGLMLENWLQ
ncbi:MAG: type II toxin-antitoxin system VapC family toxin [Okeania sp. SIO2D1]|nr:type II toxin-antitoxin system VapC family toxin [Okeania sp. SIO2D1]